MSIPESLIMKRHDDRPWKATVWKGIAIEVDWTDYDPADDVGEWVYMMACTVDGSPLPDAYNDHPSYVSRGIWSTDLAAADGPVMYMRGCLDRLVIGNKEWVALVAPVEQGELF